MSAEPVQEERHLPLIAGTPLASRSRLLSDRGGEGMSP
jgi:hypothetical protein